MLRTDRATSRVGTATVNVPSSLMVEEMVVPWTDTCPEVTASPVSESITFPVTMRVWADTEGAPTTARVASNQTTLKRRIGTPCEEERVKSGEKTTTTAFPPVPSYSTGSEVSICHSCGVAVRGRSYPIAAHHPQSEVFAMKFLRLAAPLLWAA